MTEKKISLAFLKPSEKRKALKGLLCILFCILLSLSRPVFSQNPCENNFQSKQDQTKELRLGQVLFLNQSLKTPPFSLPEALLRDQGIVQIMDLVTRTEQDLKTFLNDEKITVIKNLLRFMGLSLGMELNKNLLKERFQKEKEATSLKPDSNKAEKTAGTDRAGKRPENGENPSSPTSDFSIVQILFFNTLISKIPRLQALEISDFSKKKAMDLVEKTRSDLKDMNIPDTKIASIEKVLEDMDLSLGMRLNKKQIQEKLQEKRDFLSENFQKFQTTDLLLPLQEKEALTSEKEDPALSF